MSEPNHHTTKCFSENILAIETKKIIVKINKLLYLGLSILEIGSISFGMIILNQELFDVVQIAWSIILKLKMFIKTWSW